VLDPGQLHRKASCCYSSSLLAGGFVKQLEEGFFGKKESIMIIEA
jgi:hypothetical protein